MKKSGGILLSFLFLFGFFIFSPHSFNIGPDLKSQIDLLAYFSRPAFIGIPMLMAGLKLVKATDTSVSPLPIDFGSKVVIKVNLTFKEYLRASLSLMMGSYRIYLFFVFAFILLINLFSIPHALDLNSYGVWILLGFIMTPAWLLYLFRKRYYSNKAIQEEITYTISKESIHVISSSLDSTNNWKNIFKVNETRGFFFIYTSSIVAYIIPKSAFDKTEDIDLLRCIIRSYTFEKKLWK